MTNEFQSYLTFENIYLWSNFAILPFWIMLILVPNSNITKIFTNSIIIPLILASAYVYTLYQIILLDEPVINIFKLYLGIDHLYTIFASENFLLIFWLHFISINIFLGSWVSRDAFKHNISRKLVFVPLVLIYIMGPVGIVSYWFIRIFFAKKLGFHD